MNNDRKAAIEYLRPIMESATLPNYQRALRLALEDMERVEAMESTIEKARETIRLLAERVVRAEAARKDGGGNG